MLKIDDCGQKNPVLDDIFFKSGNSGEEINLQTACCSFLAGGFALNAFYV